MGLALGVIGFILTFLSIIAVIVFGILFVIYRSKDKNQKRFKTSFITSSAVLGASLIISIIGIGILSVDSEDTSIDQTSTETPNDTKSKDDKKPVAFSYDENKAIADKNGKFSVTIKVKDGYVPELTDTDATLKKKDENKYVLTGTINKNEDSNVYDIDFTSNDDVQNEIVYVDNTVANKAFIKKKRADTDKITRKQALDNEAKFSYGMLNKSQDGYIGEPYHVTKGHVMQAMEEDGTTTLLVNLTDKGYGFWDDLIAVYFEGKTDAIDDDFIEISGTLGEKWEYSTKIGGSNSVPTLKADEIKVIGHLK